MLMDIDKLPLKITNNKNVDFLITIYFIITGVYTSLYYIGYIIGVSHRFIENLLG